MCRRTDAKQIGLLNRYAITNAVITEERLGKKILHVVKHAEGEILRGKGIVADGCRGLVFHYLPGSLSIEPANIVGNQVCFIGTGLDEQQIHTLFREETT